MLAALTDLFGVVAPVFVIAAIGYGWVKAGGAFDHAATSRLVLQLGVPAMVFHSLVRLTVPADVLLRMAGLATAAMLGFAVLGYALLRALRLPAHTYLGPLVFSNSGNVGLPVCLFAFGDQGLALAMAYFAVSSTAHVVLGGPLFAGQFSWRPLVQSPLTWTVVVTVLLLWLRVPIPLWVLASTKLLGDFAIPLMLLTLGASLSTMHAANVGRALRLSFARIAIGAGVAFALCAVFEIRGLTRQVLVMESAMPVGVLNYLFAQRYGRAPGQLASIVLISTLMAMVTIPALLYVVR
ncbi:MAG: AEC family transporter [Polyangiales bacterium]|nr:AEC family transporter [Myxococcales bacterium]MCB9660445.1 AEC family transporter [Sandaracinaceae bacterium]